MDAGYYVTMKRLGRTAWLLGPYETQEAAADQVCRGRVLASEIDPWADFDAFGTAHLASRVTPSTVFGK